MPIGYYPAWLEIEKALLARFADWLPSRGLPNKRFVRPDQKRREMELADLVLAPSRFVADSILRFANKPVAIVPYGVDTTYWMPPSRQSKESFIFLYVGQLSIRKGTPLLLEAWKRADLKHAKLRLVGSWQLSEGKKRQLPGNCSYVSPISLRALKAEYQAADVFVLPSFFEGQALVGGEALASGLPLITTEASGWSEYILQSVGWLFRAGDQDRLVEILRWVNAHRDLVPEMARSARARALQCSWKKYRLGVSEAVAPYC
jgi:glycosyltransferase involved in cell wall biosynthesis